MPYYFEPLSEEELDSSNLIEPGIYDFCVMKDTKKLSKSNNEMAELMIQVWDKKGNKIIVFDFLVFSKVNLNIRKIKHFCDSTGLQEAYKKGEIPDEMEGLSGKVEIGIKDPSPREGGGFYPKKNIVIDYVVSDSSVKKNELIDDEIPF